MILKSSALADFYIRTQFPSEKEFLRFGIRFVLERRLYVGVTAELAASSLFPSSSTAGNLSIGKSFPRRWKRIIFKKECVGIYYTFRFFADGGSEHVDMISSLSI